MNEQDILFRLVALYNDEVLDDAFKTRESCIQWSNQVAPLLKFNQEYYTNFVKNAQLLHHKKLSSHTTQPALETMTSQVERAIEELQIKIANPPPKKTLPLKLPSEATLFWFFTNSPPKTQAKIITLLLAILGIGFTLGYSEFFSELYKLINKHFITE